MLLVQLGQQGVHVAAVVEPGQGIALGFSLSACIWSEIMVISSSSSSIPGMRGMMRAAPAG